MKKTILAILTAAVTVATGQAQILIAGWDFQTTANGGTATAASPSTPKVYTANFGSGTLYFDGSNGSSNWFVPASGSTGTELNAFTGTSVNTAGTTLSTVTSGGALAVVGGASNAANGKYAVFKFNMSGYSDLVVSYTGQTSNLTSSFQNQTWEYSADGSNWTLLQTISAGSTAGTMQTSFVNTGVLTLQTITALNNDSEVFLRTSFSGATTSTSNWRLDNVQFNAVPEPSSTVLMVLGAAGLIGIRAMRRKNS